MKYRQIVFLFTVIMMGCNQGGGLSFEGGRVHEVTAYHHQVVVGDSIALEGYVYGVKRLGGRDYIVTSIGSPFVCGDSNKFVLNKMLSVIIVEDGVIKSVSDADVLSKDVMRGVNIERFFNMRDSLALRLPMLFDSNGCSLQK